MTEGIYNLFHKIQFYNNSEPQSKPSAITLVVEKGNPIANTRASQRRLRTETFAQPTILAHPIKAETLPEDLLQKRVDKANLLLDGGFYIEALAALDQLYDGIDKTEMISRYIEEWAAVDPSFDDMDQTVMTSLAFCRTEFSRASCKAICLEMLGRSEEALEQTDLALKEAQQMQLANALERIAIIKFWKEIYNKSPDNASTGDLSDYLDLVDEEETLVRQINQGFEQSEEERKILYIRGFIHFSLHNKEQAILDFRPYFSTDSCMNSIFVGKILEKKLDAQILPSEMDELDSYELLLLHGNYTEALQFYAEHPDNDWDLEKTLCYAMLDQFDKSFECCHHITESDDQDPPYESLLYWLKGDYEKAKNFIWIRPD